MITFSLLDSHVHFETKFFQICKYISSIAILANVPVNEMHFFKSEKKKYNIKKGDILFDIFSVRVFR